MRTISGALMVDRAGQKVGKDSSAAEYIPLSQACKRAGMSDKAFKRLCILKGVYTRVPPRPLKLGKGPWYHEKDVRMLNDLDLTKELGKQGAFRKKLLKLAGASTTTARRILIKQNREQGHLSLGHAMGYKDGYAAGTEPATAPDYIKINPTSLRMNNVGFAPDPEFLAVTVRERYPSFDSAIADLPDCLSTVSLYACTLKVSFDDGPSPYDVNMARRALDDFMLFCVKTRALTKVFATIRGYYFETTIRARPIIWLYPHEYATTTPEQYIIDWKNVMSPFSLFYINLLHFINLRLYNTHEIKYPPELTSEAVDNFGRFLALLQNHQDLKSPNHAMAYTDSPSVGSDGNTTSVNQCSPIEQNVNSTLFTYFVFYLSTEVPSQVLSFVISACGGKVVTDPANATYIITDRPSASEIFSEHEAELVQPQWVFDSINCGTILPTRIYLPSVVLPAHLSPFINDAAQGYIPKDREYLDKLAGKSTESCTVQETVPTILSNEEIHRRWKDQVENRDVVEIPENTTLGVTRVIKRIAIEEAAEERAKEAIMENKSLRIGAYIPDEALTEVNEEVERARMILNSKQRKIIKEVEEEKIQQEKEAERLYQRRTELEKNEFN